MSNLVEHAKRELELAGFFDKDSDYDGALGESVLKLIEVFAKQGHTGGSAPATLNLFNILVNFDTIVPLTNKSDEWYDASAGLQQSKRNPSIFSDDGLQTYFDVRSDGKSKKPLKKISEQERTISVESKGGTEFNCLNCKSIVSFAFDTKIAYCPKCGAKMLG